MKTSAMHTRLTQFQLGRTIAEVMIALSLGLIIVAGVMGAFVSSQQSATQTNASAKLAQELIAVMNLLGQQIRQAGASDLYSSSAAGDRARRLTVPVITGCDSGYALLGNSIPLVESSTPCSSAGGNSDALTLGSQVLAVNCTGGGAIDYYSGQDYSNSSWGKDVLGQCVPAQLNTQGVVISEVMQRFFVHTKPPSTGNPNPAPALYARTSSVGGTSLAQNAAQPMFPNVEQMRLSYLVSSTGNAEGDIYLSAKHVEYSNNWRNVVGVRVCIVMSTQDSGVAQTAANNYVDCDGVTQVGVTNKLYRSSTSLFLIRSRATPVSHVNA